MPNRIARVSPRVGVIKWYVLAIGLSSLALASGGYPTQLIADVGGSATPPDCDVCHSTKGGGGNPTQAFGIAMVNKGLSGGSANAKLKTAIEALKTDMTDSDKDGVIDYDEIKNGTNPNKSDTTTEPQGPPDPKYGCNASSFEGVLALLAAAVVTRRRKVSPESGGV